MKKLSLVFVFALVSIALYSQTDTVPQPPSKPIFSDSLVTAVKEKYNINCDWAETVRTHVEQFGYDEIIIHYSTMASYVHGWEVIYTKDEIIDMEKGMFVPFQQVQKAIISYMEALRD